MAWIAVHLNIVLDLDLDMSACIPNGGSMGGQAIEHKGAQVETPSELAGLIRRHALKTGDQFRSAVAIAIDDFAGHLAFSQPVAQLRSGEPVVGCGAV